ncbi:MAG: hypothetical protein MUF45_11775 [Spirosomaceae bacterium]|jgi:hypothetical protein|nr:hypothetical protein [Spirosomataceae bacterium]
MKTLKLTLLFALLVQLNTHGQFLTFGRPNRNQPVDSSAIDEIPEFRAGWHYYFGGVIASGSFLLRNNLSQYLKKENIPFDNHFETAQFGMGFTKSKFKLDLEMGANFNGRDKNDKYITRSSGLFVSLIPSYSIIKTRNRSLYFFSGLSYSEYDILVEKKQKVPIDFDDLGKVPQSVSYPTLTHSNFLIDLGLQFIHTAKRRRDVVESFKVGYRHGLNERAWKSQLAPLNNAPIDRQRIIYFQANIQISKNYPKK